MRSLPVAIKGTGRFLPAKVVPNAYFESIVDTTDEWIVARTGIRERRIAAEGETTATSAAAAARDALQDAGLAAEQIELIILATITPEVTFPASACFVQDLLGVKDVPAFDLGASCCGFVYGLATAANFVATGFYRHVLVVGADIMTRITNFEDRGTCVLFGDGAGAAILGPAEQPEQGLL